MGLVEIKTFIRAPIERCFDLCRSVDIHVKSASHTSERAIAGVTSGLMNLGETVTWEARHFGIVQTLTVRITAFERPRSFRDSQVRGIFKFFDHDHIFNEADGGTWVRDVFAFGCPLGPLGWLADPFVSAHMKQFLTARNEVIRQVAEGEDWRAVLK